ncbi:MAG TPA: hypothetical protein VK662_09060 [Acidothermaceae bacterium]|jgi:hypothetical protein|nr:hypothetical protein [Acidothermaceae bacterium]
MDRGTGGSSDDLPGGTPAGVPIVVPDDARELARDIAAWRREERWRRRRAAIERRLFGGPPSSRGISAPLIITLLVAVALLGATLAFPGSAREHAATAPVPLVLAAPSAALGTVGGLVPNDSLLGQTGTTTAQALRPALLAVAKPGCACAAALSHLTDEAAAYGLTIYLIGPASQKSDLTALAGATDPAQVQVMVDQGSVLTTDFARGPLTVVGVHADGVIEVIVDSFLRTTSLDNVLGELKQPAHAGA